MADDKQTWTPPQRLFMEWLTLPSDVRTPKTQRLYAKKIGVDEATLSRWKQLPGWSDEVVRLARIELKQDAPAIFAALRNQAKAGNFPHIKLFLEMIGEYSPTNTLEVSGKNGQPIQIDNARDEFTRRIVGIAERLATRGTLQQPE